jgi:hypothetical protein
MNTRVSKKTLSEAKGIITEEICKAWGEYKAGHTNWCGSMIKLREEFRQDILTSNMYWTETLVIRGWVSEIVEGVPVD